MRENRKLLFIFFWILVLLCYRALLSLDPGRPVYRYINRIWDSDVGLPQDTVYDITQDNVGYVWIGTDEGVVRFDGDKFKIFNSANTWQIKNNSVTALHMSAAGTLWIGTFGGGITTYKDGKFTNYQKERGLPDNFTWEICEDRRGNIWIATVGGGLIRFKDGAFTAYTTADGLSHNIVRAVVEDHRGRLWIGTENGLDSTPAEAPGRFTHHPGLSGKIIMSLFEDDRQNLWVGTTDGLGRLAGGKTTTFTRDQGLAGNLVHCIFEDRDKNLWIGSEEGLTRRSPDGRFESLTSLGGLSDNSILHIFEDREGNLWVGTSGKGVNMLHDSKFTFYTTRDGLSQNTVRAIFEDRQKTLWIGTNGGGLNRLRKGKIDRFTTADGLAGNFINSLLGDPSGRLWVGTSKGLCVYNGRDFSKIQLDRNKEPGALAVQVLFVDRSRDLWVGTYGSGLYLYRDGRFHPITKSLGLADDFVISITQDHAGHIWVGTNNGLTRIQQERGKSEFRTYLQKDGLSHTMIYDLYADDDGSLWIGTDGGGLNRLEKGGFTVFNTDAGLFSNVVYRILEDGRGNFWMSSNKGIFSVAKADLLRYADGEIPVLRCQYFQEDDGLGSSVCSSGFQPAGWQGAKGNLYFPTNRGVAVINPGKVKFNEVRPPVVIEKIVVDGVALVPQKLKKRAFPPGTRQIEFHFTALSFTAPKKVTFSYRLSDIEKRWQETRSREKVVYEDLPPGTYTFRVTAGNNDNTWNYKGATFAFSIRYGFYQTAWFKLALIFILLFVAILLLRNKKIALARILKKGEKYRASRLEPWQAKHYLGKLTDYMVKEAPYRDPEITVEKLAGQLGLPEKHLSQLLNEQLKQNFNNFINKYRVEEAQQKILDPKEKDFVLLKIAYDVGFNSKSAFNAAFKKFSQMSPSQYRKAHGEQEPKKVTGKG